jgi:hypothetical protein
MRDWKSYNGDGFSLRYPAHASLFPAKSHPSNYSGIAIRGSNIDAENLNGGSSDERAFSLIVSAFPNPAGRTTEQWVDSVRQFWNRELQPDSLEFLEPPDTVVVNGLKGLRLRPFCGDCAPEEIYVTDSKHAVVLSYVFDDTRSSLDLERQRKLYQAILSTFAWEANQSPPPARPNTR